LRRDNHRKMQQRKEPPRLLIGGLVAAAIIIAWLLLSGGNGGGDGWKVTQDGTLVYPASRGDVAVDSRVLESGNSTLYLVTFDSRGGAKVSGLLRVPASAKRVPAVLILPGATVPKEGEQGLAQWLAGLGYASLAIDQRNLGGIDFQGDLGRFRDEKEPIQHMMVYDALRAFDLLRQDERIDPDRIVIIGSSNGGRFALIAAALEPSVRGVIGISTAGYGIDGFVRRGEISDPEDIRFYRSVDPDRYIAKLSPRKVVLLHSINDSVIPYGQALNTFTFAKQPKKLYNFTGSSHGESSEMLPVIQQELKEMFS